MPLLAVGTTTSFDLVKQYLGDVGITVNYTQLDVNTAINDIIAAKYAASFFELQMDPTAWQVANFVLTEAATFNVFHQPDETVADLVATIQTGRGRGRRRHRGAQQVRRRPGLVQPLVPRRGQLRRERRHRRHPAERQRLPLPLEHQAEGLTRARIGPPSATGRRPTAHPIPSMPCVKESPMLRFVLRRLAAGAVLVVVLSSLAYLLLYISGGQHRPQHPRPVRPPRRRSQQKKQELGLDQPAAHPVRRLGVQRPPGRPGRLLVHRPAGRPRRSPAGSRSPSRW